AQEESPDPANDTLRDLRRMPLGPAWMIVLTQSAGDQYVTEKQEHIAQGHRETEHQGQKDGQDHQSQRPVALGQRLEEGDEVEDRQRQYPECRRKEDQEPQSGPVRERVEACERSS